MAVNTEAYQLIKEELNKHAVTLVAVSKFKPVEDLQVLYDLGQRDFGENFVQELVMKYEAMPKNIRWHFIGHLQSNKVKYIAPFVHLIHGVDKEKLLREIDKQAAKSQRVIDCLLQVHIAEEETKVGFNEEELKEVMESVKEKQYPNVCIRGLMGMASFTGDQDKISFEFKSLADLFKPSSLAEPHVNLLSMGMSNDYAIAIKEGSNMVRIGSLIFGAR